MEAGEAILTGWQRELEATSRRSLKLLQMCLEPPRVQIGATPHQEIYRRNKLRLLRYKPQAERIYPVPLLMVPSMINRCYILDLTPARSLVEYLLSRGIDVYMLDWGEPGDEDATTSFDAYIVGYLDRVVKKVARRSSSEQISLLGYCMGGTLTTVYTALRPQAIKNMINLAAPIDFKDGGLLSRWTAAPTTLLINWSRRSGTCRPSLCRRAFKC